MRSALWFLSGIITGLAAAVFIAIHVHPATDVPMMMTRSCVCDEWKEAP